MAETGAFNAIEDNLEFPDDPKSVREALASDKSDQYDIAGPICATMVENTKGCSPRRL